MSNADMVALNSLIGAIIKLLKDEKIAEALEILEEFHKGLSD